MRGEEKAPAATLPWRLVALVALVSLAAALARLPTRSVHPASWDPANFALAVERLDLEAHQPHPPAAIGYVLAARALHAAGADPNLALELVNLLLAAPGGVLVFAFAWHASAARRERHGWLALVAMLSSPLLWFYGVVAEIYVAETVLGLAVAYGCLRLLQAGDEAGSSPAALPGSRAVSGGASRARRYGVFAGLALALLAAFRVTGAAFLVPVFAWALWRTRSRRAVAWALASFVLGAAAWAVPLLAWAGPAAYVRVFLEHAVRTTEPTSVFTHGSSRVLARHAREALYALVAAVGLFNTIALPPFLLLRRPRLRPAPPLAAFAALWALPALAFYVLVHMAKPGYALPALPVAAVALAFLYGQAPRALLALLVFGQIAGGAWQFLVAEPATGAAVGEGRLYSRKTWLQKARVELGSVLQTSRAAIVLSDRQIVAVEREVAASCPGADGIVLVARDHAGPNWRKLMYVFPQAQAVRLPADSGAPWMVARGHRFEAVPGDELSLRERCRTYWVDLPPAVIDALAARATVERVEADALALYWTSGPVVLPLEDGRRLAIR